MTRKILIVEDDIETAAYMERGFVEQGYAVDRTADGREGLFLATGQDYDAVVLDRMLPGLDGLSVLKAVRAAGVQTPVLILSAMGALDERVRGLRAGSDDYLVKPFAFVELHARIDALIRRSAAGTEAPPSRLVVADLELDLLSRKVTRAGRPIPLQQREFQMLEYLMRHAGRVVTRTMLLEGVWNYHFDPQTNVIDVHISRLRQKVDKDFDSPLIHTVRGSGYMLALDG
ncbi:Response regulator consisting of a CheY-like receiver domain and a winged-helix DNA-binding domain [alpha proteobacterium BAL199]|nr:Response regulator consisting of a CheY-like receiver domain and a winged-helix DNA-binding domain [alpha proteobacterium BAL199]